VARPHRAITGARVGDYWRRRGPRRRHRGYDQGSRPGRPRPDGGGRRGVTTGSARHRLGRDRRTGSAGRPRRVRLRPGAGSAGAPRPHLAAAPRHGQASVWPPRS
jgi:hypothetical protein